MRKNRRFEEDEGVSNEWLNTYADLMSLLLTFFVLLFSMATININKFQTLILSINRGLGIEQIRSIDLKSGEQLNTRIFEDKPPNQDELKKIYEKLGKYINENKMNDKIKLVLDERGLTIRFVDTVLFDTGKADLKPESLEILSKVSNIIKNDNHPIKIEGHTDNVPINNSKYPSNWELSTDRAVTVLKYLVNVHHFPPERLSAEGFGEYRPVVPNNSDANRAKNRRVDIVILRNRSE
ncbi:chemotaxis protein MotB [Caldanaerobius fijiensis DSM 17918]|uniref:Chemotaxis protein MotB n=1 Tax=Caldanaerobius fijiensis DSM 17918 TaxID=1121256 RepID=A0A1M4XMX7_9THEO|nr:OmpA family protein [Caldanaerobius fijiensis]SHE94623.1 chemotaxis protein MotB [Caldanaerobius fijiensis DSM 17918]